MNNEAKKTVLIVEDEIIIALRLKMELSENGFTVIGPITNGEEAIASARQENPDIVLMDTKLAGEMDGIQAAQEILSSLSTAIIFLTGYADEEMRMRAEKLSPCAYLLKPVDIEDIIDHLKRAFESGYEK